MPCPYRSPGSRPDLPNGGDCAEHLRLGTDRGHIGQAVPAERDCGRDIEQQLARIMTSA